jgi:CheY-like chemotaxis protein
VTAARAKWIAIVEDDEDIREALSFLLEAEGFAVLTANNGRDVLEKLRAPAMGLPALILLDLMMPVMSGAQFLAEQRLDPVLASIPVCLMSASSGLRKTAEELGTDFLEKPVTIEQLLARVMRYCG